MLGAMIPSLPSSAPRPSATFALLLALFVTSCAKPHAGGPGGAAGMKMPPMPVEVAQVAPRTVRDQFHALGSLEAGDIVKVAGEASGVVVRLPFEEGRAVRGGALLAQLDDREVRADLAQTTAQRDQAKANLTRAEKLAAENLISAQQLEDTRTALRVADAAVGAAAARYDHTRIRAPFAGFVGRRTVSPGAYLRAGDPVTDLARVDEMKVAFAAPERYMNQLRIGTPVSLNVPAFPGQSFAGRITVVDPVVDEGTRTAQLVARIGNPGRILRPGMSADVAVTLSERLNALVVPSEAVFAEGNQTFVYVIKADHTVARAAVVLGTRDSTDVEVLHGLAAGQQVVRTGQQKLFDGATVMPAPDAGTAQAVK